MRTQRENRGSVRRVLALGWIALPLLVGVVLLVVVWAVLT
jgi:hypothetical protein